MNEIMVPPVPALPGSHRFCFGCGKPIHVSALACPHCGAQAETAAANRTGAVALRGREVFCWACGSAINAAAPLCPTCGAPQGRMQPQATKSRIAAALLAIFLGGLGVHKFYLGRPVQGIFYVLFCWTFIPAILGFIAAVIYLCSSATKFARKYD